MLFWEQNDNEIKINAKVVEFDSESKAMYRRKKLNADLGPNEPQWEMTTIFGKPMLRRRWED